MTKPQVKEHNSETDEVIIRDMTNEEYQAYLDNQVAISAHEEKVKADDFYGEKFKASFIKEIAKDRAEHLKKVEN